MTAFEALVVARSMGDDGRMGAILSRIYSRTAKGICGSVDDSYLWCCTERSTAVFNSWFAYCSSVDDHVSHVSSGVFL